jgi:hypothetical protein
LQQAWSYSLPPRHGRSVGKPFRPTGAIIHSAIRTSRRPLLTTTAPAKAPDRSARAGRWCSSASSKVQAPSVRATVTIRLTLIFGRLGATDRAHGFGAGQNRCCACRTTCIGALRPSHRLCLRLIAATGAATTPLAGIKHDRDRSQTIRSRRQSGTVISLARCRMGELS